MLPCRCLVIATSTLMCLVSGNAHAQDWSGAYAGVHAGYRWGTAHLNAPAYTFPDGAGGTTSLPARTEKFSLSSGIGGGHIGFNYRLSRDWLIGVESDITAGGGSDRASADFTTSHTATTFETVVVTTTIPANPKTEEPEKTVTTETIVAREQTVTTQQHRVSSLELGWQGTVRARLGYTQGAWLFYATGGLAFIQANWSETVGTVGGSPATANFSDVLTGWTVGGGVETFIAPQWIARLEYLYEDFGRSSVPLAFTSRTGNLDLQAHKLRAGLSFKF